MPIGFMDFSDNTLVLFGFSELNKRHIHLPKRGLAGHASPVPLAAFGKGVRGETGREKRLRPWLF